MHDILTGKQPDGTAFGPESAMAQITPLAPSR